MIELILSMSIWGTLGIFVLWSGVSATEIAFYRCAIGVVCIGLYLLKNRQSIKFNKQTLLVAIAGIFMVYNWVFLFKSFQLSSITIGNMSYYLQPIILIILGVFIYKEKVSLYKWILIIVSFIGVILTINIQSLTSKNIMLGVLFALLAALFYSFVTLLMRKSNERYFQVIFIQLFIGTIILFPSTNFHKLNLTAALCLLIMGLVHTILAFFLYYRAIKKTNFATIAVLSYLDPIVAIATDIIFFKRSLNSVQVFGVTMTFVAAYLLISANKQRVTK